MLGPTFHPKSVNFIIFFFAIAIITGTLGVKRSEDPTSTVFKFIYNNEAICGNMFSNSSTWLPAHQNCELKCRMDAEICQQSSESVLIRRQRCWELPLECRRRLKQLLGGAELYTKPAKRMTNNAAVGAPKKVETAKPKGTPRAPAQSLPQNTTAVNAGRNVTRQPKLTRPLTTSPELVPLTKDANIFIAPAQMFSPSTPKGGKQEAVAKQPKGKTKPAHKKEKPKAPSNSLSEKAAAPTRPKHVPTPSRKHTVDDSAQLAYQALYMATEADKRGQTVGPMAGGAKGKQPKGKKVEIKAKKAMETTSTTTATTTTQQQQQKQKHSHVESGTTAPAQSAEEMKSAELPQLFMGNPFGESANNTAPDQSVLSAPAQSQTALELLPESKDNNSIFGPPLSAYDFQAQQYATKDYNYATTTAYATSETTAWMASSSPQVLDISKKGGAEQLKMPESMDELEGRQLPWWSWRELAESMRKRPFYSAANAVLALDKSARCCHWALDGLCDRSWQRVRELCPKSCGTLVCSSIDGTLSCNRAINVDVIACYEQRRLQNVAPRVHAAPSQIVEDGTVAPEVARRAEREDAERRRFAVEKEIVQIRALNEQMERRWSTEAPPF